jgi:hypothetical protein
MAVDVMRDGRTREEVRRELHAEREQLAQAVESLRTAADLRPALRANLPIVAVAAFAAMFVLGGGIGATMRLLARRGREGHETVRLGRWVVVERK